MANRFLTSGTGDLSDGTQNILGAYIGANNLLGGSTVKVNTLKQLVSTNLLISDILGLSSTLGGKISNPSTVPITATSFVKTGGTSVQYLMADGSVTTASANGNSSNIYLYDNNTTTTPPPASKQIRYNNSVQDNATEIYISHLTRDLIDIDEFLALISDLSIIYIQDQENSSNFIKYTVTGSPTITPNSYTSVPVLKQSSGGTGATSFGVGHNIFMSIFTNTTLVDNRITTLEGKTQNASAISGTTTFTGNIVGDNIKTPTGLSSEILLANGTVNNTVIPDITNATSNNTVSTIVKRDASGNFLCGKINSVYLKNNTTENISLSTAENNSTGLNCIIIGNGMPTSTGINNISVGKDSMSLLTSGTGNLSVGNFSNNKITTGRNNTCIGTHTNSNNIISDNNTSIGYNAMNLNTAGLNTALGAYAGDDNITFSNTTCIGYNSQCTASNQIVLGDTGITEVKSSGTFYGSGFKVPFGTSTQLLSANGSVLNSDSSNTPNTIVKRDFNGNFIAGTITATLNGNSDSSTNITITNSTANETYHPLFSSGAGSNKSVFNSGNLTFNASTNLLSTTGTFKSNNIADKNNSGGSFGEVLTCGNGGELVWGNNQSSISSNWRFQSFGYYGTVPTTSNIDSASGWMVNQGGSLTLQTVATTNIRTLKYRVQSNVASTVNGAISGWLGTSASPPIFIRQGFKIVIGFGLGDTSTNALTRSMIGLYQANTAPTLNNTTTVASVTTQSIGIIQESGDNVWSFNTRGSTNSFKADTIISCQTPSTTWFTLEMFNQVNSNDVYLTLIDQANNVTSNVSFTAGTFATINTTSQCYIQCQRNMSSPGGVAGSAILQTASFRMWSST